MRPAPFVRPRASRRRQHWSYEGAEGPDHWGEPDTASKACSLGTQESPIDIRETINARLPPLKFSWARTADTIVNNGHTIQVNMGDNSALAVSNRKNFRLVQFHFHHPSEHTINGASFPMEVHFVHTDEAGNLAVIGVLMTAGRINKVFNAIVLTMPNGEGPPIRADTKIDPNGLLPSKRSYYRYEGSLTTPPCDESVDWFVLTEPIHVAEADINSFARLYPQNARPVQKDNRRFVLRSS